MTFVIILILNIKKQLFQYYNDHLSAIIQNARYRLQCAISDTIIITLAKKSLMGHLGKRFPNLSLIIVKLFMALTNRETYETTQVQRIRNIELTII